MSWLIDDEGGDGRFCPLALASEIVGERWTPLVLRELMLVARASVTLSNRAGRWQLALER